MSFENLGCKYLITAEGFFASFFKIIKIIIKFKIMLSSIIFFVVVISLGFVAASLAWFNFLKPVLFRALNRILFKKNQAWKTQKY